MNKIKQEKILDLIKSKRYSANKYGIIFAHTINKINIIGQRQTAKGYMLITLAKIPERLDLSTHQFIWLFFNGAYDPQKQINHKDGNKRNNRIDNLEVVTASENQIHSQKVLGNAREQNGEKNAMCKLTGSKVKIIRKLHKEGVSQRELARMYGVTYGNINCIVLHKTWKEL